MQNSRQNLVNNQETLNKLLWEKSFSCGVPELDGSRIIAEYLLESVEHCGSEPEQAATMATCT